MYPSKDFLEALKPRLEPRRPAERRKHEIDTEDIFATLTTNYHYISQHRHAEGYTHTIEIKPKAFRPEKILKEVERRLKSNSKLLKDNPSIYHSLLSSKVMEFDLKQVQKILKGSEKYFTNYSPAKLFSNNKDDILSTLKDLRACPQNNFKIHKNGKLTGFISNDQLELIVEILNQTKVLDSIKEAQAVTNKNIEEVYNIYTEKCKIMTETDSRRIIEEVMPKCLDTGVKFNQDEQNWAEVLKYLFSMSARDCSIMLTYCPVNEMAGSEIRLERNEILLMIKERQYVVNVGVIDFDIKLIKKIKQYYTDKTRLLQEYIDFYSN